MQRSAREILKQSRRYVKVEQNRISLPAPAASLVQLSKPNLYLVPKRPLSSVGASGGGSDVTKTAAAAASNATNEQTKKKKDDNSNIFLDNLGKIFLTVIASIIAVLVRSSRNTKNRMIIRDQMEEAAIVDPMEIDDLRVANSELTPEVFREIIRDVYANFTDGACTYQEFVKAVRKTMMRLKGEAFTVQLGHMLDRVVVHVLKVREKSSEDRLPLSLWLSMLTMALNSSVGNRVRILFEILEQEESPVTFSKVLEMVGYLQDTWQLPADAQIIPTEEKYPTQQWKIGTPAELVPWEGLANDQIDVEAFASIVRSNAVCAWGECYHKKKFDSVDDM